MTLRTPCLATSAALLLLLASVSTTNDAHACGGTFCDRGPPPTPAQPNPPPPMPVDQTGENILFVMDGETVEAHVNIQYVGDPERFAWVVPMPSAPTSIEPGSQPLFSNMLDATVPTLGQDQVKVDTCGASAFTSGTLGCASSDEASGASSPAGSFDSGAVYNPSPTPSTTTVVEHKQVGAYDVTVLSGGTATELLDWLDTNGFVTPDSTAPLLQSYLEQKYSFVAIRLVAGAGLREIHPITFKYPGDRPCVPLKLTAVAAKEDLELRAFFLATSRFVPKNYKHILLNDARLDWLAPFMGMVAPTPAAKGVPPLDLSGYKALVSRAVDSPVADGRAFVTEYAGSSSVVSAAGITSTAWQSAPLRKLKASFVPATLTGQGILTCQPSGKCASPYPVLLSLLRQYLPTPKGMSEGSYYLCSSCIEQDASSATFDANKFADDYEAKVIVPSQRAVNALSSPYLTRMFTTISPAEMTEDPEFGRNSMASAAVSNKRNAKPHVGCYNQQIMTLPSGHDVALDGTFQTAKWPTFGEDMPYAERIEQYSFDGPPVVLVDNREKIDAILANRNASRNWPARAQLTFRDVSTRNGCAALPRGGRGTVLGAFGIVALLGLARRLSRRGRAG